MVPRLNIRAEIPADGPAIRAIHLLAFETSQEANLVDKLRNHAAAQVSMVAEHDGAIVGHLLFSPVKLGVGMAETHGLGLAPIGVLPHLQKRGIGSQLIRSALRGLEETGCPFVVALGNPGFYARFGFRPAREFGVRCKWDVPADSFMLLPLDKDRIALAAGLAHYSEEFDSLV